MARVYKKKSDNSYEPVADTQGLVVPVDVSECYARRPGGTLLVVGDSPVKLPIVYYEGQQWVNASNEVVVPLTGYYLIDHIVYIEGGSTAPQARYTSVYRNGSDTLRTNTVEMAITATAWTNPHFAGVRKLNAGDRLTLTAWATDSTTMNVNSAHLYVTLLKQTAPYLIANKGALVSGGAFQFDNEGNAYTENYSTGEVRCGKWIDGKPIYKKTLDFAGKTFSAWSPLTLGPVSTLLPDVDRILKSENVQYAPNNTVTGELKWLQIMKSPDGLSVYGYSGWGETVTNISFYSTVYYTKTTD
jgi:hypothetical protein